MRERDPERGRIGREPVGHGQRVEDAAYGEAVHGHLGPVDELLDQRLSGRRLAEIAASSAGASSSGEDTTDTATCPWRSAGFTTSGRSSAELVIGGIRHELPGGLGNAGLGEPLALEALRHGDLGRGRIQGVRQPEPVGDASRDRHGRVDPGRDQPLDLLLARNQLDPVFVLGGDDRVPVRESQPDRLLVTVAGDDRDSTCLRRGEQPELPRAGAYDESACSRVWRMDSHQARFSTYHSMVRSRPVAKSVRARQSSRRSALSVEPMCRSTCPSRSSS